MAQVHRRPLRPVALQTPSDLCDRCRFAETWHSPSMWTTWCKPCTPEAPRYIVIMAQDLVGVVEGLFEEGGRQEQYSSFCSVPMHARGGRSRLTELLDRGELGHATRMLATTTLRPCGPSQAGAARATPMAPTARSSAHRRRCLHSLRRPQHNSTGDDHRRTLI